MSRERKEIACIKSIINNNNTSNWTSNSAHLHEREFSNRFNLLLLLFRLIVHLFYSAPHSTLISTKWHLIERSTPVHINITFNFVWFVHFFQHHRNTGTQAKCAWFIRYTRFAFLHINWINWFSRGFFFISRAIIQPVALIYYYNIIMIRVVALLHVKLCIYEELCVSLMPPITIVNNLKFHFVEWYLAVCVLNSVHIGQYCSHFLCKLHL